MIGARSRTRGRSGAWIVVVLTIASTCHILTAATPAAAAIPGHNGLIVFESNRDGDQEIYVMNSGGAHLQRLTDDFEGNFTPSWSPDGSKIPFASGRDGNAELYTMDPDGSDQTRLTDTFGDETAPAWSPVGDKIAFSMWDHVSSTHRIWVMDADGSDPVMITAAAGASDGRPSWSPDGQRIAFQRAIGATLKIVTVNADGSAPVDVTNGAPLAADPDWSPDGERLVFSRTDGIFTMNVDGAEIAPVPDTIARDGDASWSPDGSSIVFSRELTGETLIHRVHLGSSEGPVQLTPDGQPGETIPDDWSPSWQPLANAPSPAGEFTPLTPARILDTRDGTGGVQGVLGPGSTMDVQVAGRGGVPDSGAVAVALNATVTQATAHSHLTIWPTGSALPLVSNLNYMPGQTVPNLVTVAVGSDGRVSVYNNAGSTHVVFDVVGFYVDGAGPPGSRFHPLQPSRYFDTRAGSGGVPARPLAADTGLSFKVTESGGVPEGATAVVMNVTVTEPTSSGHVTVHPGDVARPTTSNLNFVAGLTVPNLVVVRVPGNGVVDFHQYSNFAGTVHLLADVVGYFDGDRSTEAGRLVTGVHERVFDTRVFSPFDGTGCVPGGGILQLTTTSTVFGAYVFNVTVVGPTEAGHLTVFPHPPPVPLASNLNFVPGQTVPNLVMAPVGDERSIDFANSAGCTHVIADVFGAFTSAAADPPGPSSASLPSELELFTPLAAA